MLALRGHPQTYSSPGWLAIQAGVVVILLTGLYLLSSPRLRRFNRKAQRMIDRQRRRS